MWFKVDDSILDHEKFEILVAISPDKYVQAMGLWTICGAYSSQKGDGGFITQSRLSHLMPHTPPLPLAEMLVAAGFWEEAESDAGLRGYQFVDWDDYNEPKSVAKAKREVYKERAKKAAAARWGKKEDDARRMLEPCLTSASSTPSSNASPMLEPCFADASPMLDRCLTDAPDPDPVNPEITHPRSEKINQEVLSDPVRGAREADPMPYVGLGGPAPSPEIRNLVSFFSYCLQEAAGVQYTYRSSDWTHWKEIAAQVAAQGEEGALGTAMRSFIQDKFAREAGYKPSTLAANFMKHYLDGRPEKPKAPAKPIFTVHD